MCCLFLLANVCKNVLQLLGKKCHSIQGVNFLSGQCLVWTAEMEEIWSEVFWPVWPQGVQEASFPAAGE